MRALDAAPEPAHGYGPSWDAMLSGRREFAGEVLGGPWAGQDVLVLAYGKVRRRQEPHPDDFSFCAEYLSTDWNQNSKNDGDGDFSVNTVDELNERLADTPIQWYPPATSLARVGRLFGGSGQIQNLGKE
jgi:hypothetical protein